MKKRYTTLLGIETPPHGVGTPLGGVGTPPDGAKSCFITPAARKRYAAAGVGLSAARSRDAASRNWETLQLGIGTPLQGIRGGCSFEEIRLHGI